MYEFVDGFLGLKTVWFGLFVGLVYLYSTWTHNHWSKLGVPEPSRPVPLFGHALLTMLGRVHFMDLLDLFYRQLGDARFGGIYTMRTPQLLVKDPELIGELSRIKERVLSKWTEKTRTWVATRREGGSRECLSTRKIQITALGFFAVLNRF